MREERPIIALDFPAFEDVKNFLEHFPEDEKLFVKIGMEFFYAVGPENCTLPQRAWTQHFP